MIRNIVFDLGGVLVGFPWKSYLHGFGFAPEIEEKIARVLFLGQSWQDADRGALSDEEIFEKVCQDAPEIKGELQVVWDGRTEIVKEYPYAAAWLQELKEAGYRIYILSNYGRTTFLHLLQHNTFLSLADGMVISYEVKSIKPEPEIYEELISRYAIRPEESLYLDDLAENIEAGKRMGFHTILFTDYEAARISLKETFINKVKDEKIL